MCGCVAFWSVLRPPKVAHVSHIVASWRRGGVNGYNAVEIDVPRCLRKNAEAGCGKKRSVCVVDVGDRDSYLTVE